MMVPAHAYTRTTELHHLLIMESLGGNSSIVDRTIAQTMAFGYYWYVVAVYAFSEPAAYHLSELIEDHAYDTYDGYLKEHEAMLKQLPVPDIARKYYIEDNPFLFDQFCTVKDKNEDGGFRLADLLYSHSTMCLSTSVTMKKNIGKLYAI